MIKSEVLNGHLARFPAEKEIIRKFEGDFEITWGSRIHRFNTYLSLYFLKPLEHITQSFGFDQELVLAISDFTVPEARLIQSIEENFFHLPARGRVDQTIAIVVSKSDNISSWMNDYIARNPQSRAYVGINEKEILQSSSSWFIRNILIEQLFSRDLFDYTLPIDEDMFFVGRQSIVAEHIDSIRKSENRGIFGLRKTGKTSVLFKVMRQCKQADINVIYYDCKLKSLYQLSGDDLIERICNDIEKTIGLKLKGWRAKSNSADKFVSLIEKIPSEKKLCLIFDEIEYLSPNSLTASHWSDDFIPFWQTIWSTQSQHRKFNFIISGVNASVVETDKFNRIQNPMFGIVKSKYLVGFEKSELFSLLTVFGKRMGMNFSETAVNILYSRYGGHPLLTRMICSQINNELKASSFSRPVVIDGERIKKDLQNREQEIQFYCGHITSELEDFYHNEYEMLEMLAVGNIVDFNDMAQDIDLVRHLKSYALVDFSIDQNPKFAIPVIKSYIASKWKKKHGVKQSFYLVPEHRRTEYVGGRISSIISDLRLLDRRMGDRGLPTLYGGFGPHEADMMARLGPVVDRDGIVNFLNQMNRSIVEPVDAVGRKAKVQDYFFETIRTNYPHIFFSLNRVRAYRNYIMHLKLNAAAQRALDEYLLEDYEGAYPDKVDSGWFRLQSIVLDGLLIGIQSEIALHA